MAPTVTFDRTVCACEECIACCQRPAHLLPEDVPRLLARAELAGITTEPLEALRAGKGAVVGDRHTGRVRRIPTITPAVHDGWCVFFDRATRRCRAHDVAPFGCAFFDVHMDRQESDRRSLAGLRVIDADPAYHALVERLRERDDS